MTSPQPGAAAPPIEEIARVLARHPIFARFEPRALRTVAGRCRSVRFPAGERIMRQGERGDFALVILDGEVDVYVEIPAGLIHMATLGRDRVVGELGGFTDAPRTATIVARSDVAALRVDRDNLMSLVADFPSIGIDIISELGNRLHSTNQSLAYLTYAANALARGEYDPTMLAELVKQSDALAVFARAFADMAAEIHAKQSRREEMQAAAAIQQSILPGPLPGRDDLPIDLHADMRPAREIGGDFYDYFMLDERRLAFTVADVSGKGIPAALFMAVSRTVMRNTAGGAEMAARMTDANRLLSAENAASMFVTMFHGVVDTATGRLQYCNAGHNPPYLLRAGGARETLPATGIPFGIDPDRPYRTGDAVLAPGDALFLFSDGITEATNPSSEIFGEERLEKVLDTTRGRDAAALVADVLAATAEFAAGAEQSDDITCLALVYRG
ncbi:MAG: SpoIIE family protein phosphatase [Alphaproteobacteria bacterium]|nr:SpoIIE family protein phosphatase [Alphaproteobacteria bacterium]